MDRPYWGGGLGALVPGRIPWRAVREYAEHHGMSGEYHAMMDQSVIEMDTVFLQHDAAKRKAG